MTFCTRFNRLMGISLITHSRETRMHILMITTCCCCRLTIKKIFWSFFIQFYLNLSRHKKTFGKLFYQKGVHQLKMQWKKVTRNLFFFCPFIFFSILPFLIEMLKTRTHYNVIIMFIQTRRIPNRMTSFLWVLHALFQLLQAHHLTANTIERLRQLSGWCVGQEFRWEPFR